MTLIDSRHRRLKRFTLGVGVALLAVTVTAPAASAANPKTKRVSVRSGGGQADDGSFNGAVSANGRFVVFESSATDLVGNDTNDKADVFVHDRKTKKTKRVSLKTGGGQGDDRSRHGSISANGRYVAFTSAATTLIGNDTNGVDDVFVHDRKTKKTKRVSVPSGGGQASGDSQDPFISGNGRFVAFRSEATDLIGNDTNGNADIFVHDRKTKKTKRVSVATGGGQSTGGSSRSPVVTPNGRFVVFRSSATNLVGGDSNSTDDIFVHDRWKKKTKRVSISTVGVQANGLSSNPSVSADGRFVAFESSASNLVGKDSGSNSDIFVRDRKAGKTKLVSVRTGGKQGNKSSYETAISATGRYVMFSSDATNLVRVDNNAQQDVFVHDRARKTTKRLSVKTNGAARPGGSEDPWVSPDGRYVVFESEAKLVKSDTNDEWEMYVRGPLH